MGLAGERLPESFDSGLEMAPDTTASRTMVELAGVSKTYETADSVVYALDDISLSVGEKEFVALVGASGCGKTTMLNIIAGLVEPTNGILRRRSELNRPGGIGMVFQSPTLLPWRTVLQNVLLPAEILEMDEEEAEGNAIELLELVGLAGFEKAYPHQLSGGMQQRVSLCRALLSDPPLLLMDEPFGALDAISRETMAVELQRIWAERQTTVLLVTHSITEALFLADRVVALTARPGKIAGVLDNDLQRPRTVQTFESADFAEYSVHIREMIKIGAHE
jgi:NitT/TauT family transport system ATP-binding protein